MPSHSNVFQVLLVFHEESCINSRRIGILKCIEDATPFPWPIKSLDLREKQYLKLRSLSLKDYCLLNKATMVSSKQLIDLADSFGQVIVHTGSEEKNSRP